MAKKLIDILSDAAVVRDETNEKANTAERVGGVMVAITEFLREFTPISEISAEATAIEVTLRFKAHEADGTPVYRYVVLPAATLSAAGVFTPTMLNSLNTADRNETTARQAADAALSERINAEATSRAEKDEELRNLVNVEVTARIGADAALSERINAEATSRAEKDEELRNLVNVEVTARIGADAELLKRIIGKSTASSAYTDPFKYIGNFASEKDASGAITKHAIRVMQDDLLDTLRNSDYHDSFPFIGHMRAHVEGVPIEMWNYVKAWNTGSTNGVFVQVVRTNFGLNNGVISSALTEAFHEYFRTVTVSMVDGSVTDVTATAWQESTVTAEQAKNINIITNLGHYSTRDYLLAAAAKINVVQLSSDNTTRILFGSYGVTNAVSVLILQHNTRTGAVSESGRGTTMQYVFDGKERYTRYIDHNASSVTAVQPLQREGVRNLYFTQRGFIGLKDMWGTQVGSGFFLPDNTAIREDAANTTATSVGLIITSFLGTTKTATLGAVTSARAGLMTVALYNELKQATAGVAEEETARINLGNHIAADIQSIRDAVATVQTNESNHYTEMQNHLSVIYKRLTAAETKLSDLEKRVQTIEDHITLNV